MSNWIQNRLKSLEEAFSPKYCLAIEQAADRLAEQFRDGQKLLICGNGGSAADAQHIAAEFVGRFYLERKGLPAIALGANPATLTAWSNDYDYETVFSRQVEAYGRPGDVLWGISTSGKSKNVLRALETAKTLGLVTIGMAGNDGGLFSPFVDYPLFVAQKNTPYTQEIHLITYHRICEQVESQLFAKEGRAVSLAV